MFMLQIQSKFVDLTLWPLKIPCGFNFSTIHSGLICSSCLLEASHQNECYLNVQMSIPIFILTGYSIQDNELGKISYHLHHHQHIQGSRIDNKRLFTININVLFNTLLR